MKLTAFLALILGSGLASAQGQPTFSVNTRLVEVDVVVRNKNAPVANLKKEDFTILDNGKPQKISTFSVSIAGDSTTKASPLPPGVVSNRLNSRGEEPAGPTLLVWDVLNTPIDDQAVLRLQILKYLRTLQPGDSIALYGLARSVRVIQDFTDDPQRLIQAVAGANPKQSTNLTDLTDTSSQIYNPIVAALGGSSTAAALADMQTMSNKSADLLRGFTQMDRAYTTTTALQAVVARLAGFPGRKKLIWFSASFPGLVQFNGPLDMSPQINGAIQALNDANVAVYPIDPRGLTTGLTMEKGTATGIGSTTSGLLASDLSTMNTLAGSTGGRASYAQNDLVAAIRDVMDDDRIVYRLGFYPSDKNLNGSYHSLSVKVGHQPDDVRFRHGYLAINANNSKTGQWRDVLNETMQIPLDATQIGLRASALPVDAEPGSYNLKVAVDLSDLHLERVKDRWVGTIDYALMFTPSESGKGSVETVQISLTDERLKAAAQEGFVFQRKISAGDKTGQLRIVIEDRATAAVGAITVPLGK